MDLYGIALFVHIVFAIILVGGSVAMHVVGRFATRATTNDQLRGHIAYMHAFSKGSFKIAAVTLIAALYMAFAHNWWGKGWPIVSLVLFAVAGAVAGGYLDPKVMRMKELSDAAPAGPIRQDVHDAVDDHGFHLASWVLAGTDVAIVYLMTNKPGYVGSVITAAVAIAIAYGIGMADARREPAVAEV